MKEYEQKICNIIDNLKVEMRYQCDRVDEQAYKQGYKQGYVEGYELGKQDGYKDGQESLVNAYAIGKGEDTLEDVKKAEYNRGLNDAWTVAKKIVLGTSKGGYPMEVLHRIFSFSNSSDIFSIYDVTDAIARIKAYEDKQKQDAEIKVGDEVYSDAFDDKGIVTHITTDKVSCVCIICNGFTMMKVGLCGLHKTGRHFPQIAEVLKEMRGAE